MSLIALAVAAGLAAQSADANELDARCIAAIAMVGASQGKSSDPGLVGGMFYFVGRIDARAPHYDIEGTLRRLVAAPDAGEQLKPDMMRCGQILQERGTFLQQVGSHLQNVK